MKSTSILLCGVLLTIILEPLFRTTESKAILATRATPSTYRLICTPNNWPPSSAFSLLLSLALGCLSHPRGSLTFDRASRIYRFSPLFLLIENTQILIHILLCLKSRSWKWKGSAVRVYCVAILALREGNAWCQGEYDAFFGGEENERFLEGDGDAGELPVGSSSGDSSSVVGDENGVQMDDLEPSTSRLTRRTTVAMEEGRSSAHGANAVRSGVGDPAKISLEDWFTIGRWIPFKKIERQLTSEEMQLMVEMDGVANKKTLQFLDARFRRDLEQVQDYENGPTYRMLLWFPMVQQLAKATLVSGAPFTISMGVVYLASFLIVEALLFAARSPLDRDDHAKAMKLLREWGMMKRIPLKEKTVILDRKIGISLKPMGHAEAGTVWVVAASIANFGLFCSIMTKFNPVTYLKGLLLLNWKILVFSFQLLPSIPWYQVPWYVVRLVVSTFDVFGFECFLIFVWLSLVLFASLAPVFVSIGLGILVRICRKKYSKSVDRQILRFSPSATAVTTALLAFMAYFGLGASGGLAYNCTTTSKRSFYDLLG